MKKIPKISIVIFLTLVFFVAYFVWINPEVANIRDSSDTNNEKIKTTGKSLDNLLGVEESDIDSDKSSTPVVISQDLDIPWELVFLPDGSMLVTERPGNLVRIKSGSKEKILIPGVEHRGEGGLLGMDLDPDFQENKYLYLYMTTSEGGGISNRVERYVFNLENNSLSEREEIISKIPGAIYHDGGRIKFSPDGFLYISTGDAGNENSAQDTNSLAGKILRINKDGSIPEDNPFGNAVYSYGHRNVQGLAWDNENRLWASEHGRSGILSGYDELNLIEKGKNYGWPVIQGNETRENMETPVAHSGPTTTWAPSGAAYKKGSIFFTGLRGEAIYEYKIAGGNLVEHFKDDFGRIRNIIVGPDENFYFLTNNTDGRGNPQENDDKIIKIGTFE